MKIQVKQEIQTHLTKSANALAMVAAHDTSCIAKRLVYRPACMHAFARGTNWTVAPKMPFRRKSFLQGRAYRGVGGSSVIEGLEACMSLDSDV